VRQPAHGERARTWDCAWPHLPRRRGRGVHVRFSRGLHDTHSVRCMEGTEAVPAATQRPGGKLERRRTRTVQSAAGAVACTRGDLAARSRCSRSSRGQLATLGMGPGRAAGAAGAAAVLLACCCLVGTMMLHGGARTALLGEPFDSNMPGDLSSVRIPNSDLLPHLTSDGHPS